MKCHRRRLSLFRAFDSIEIFFSFYNFKIYIVHLIIKDTINGAKTVNAMVLII